MLAPATIDGLQAISNPIDRAKAANTYIRNGLDKIRQACRTRDDAITALLDQGHTVVEIAAAVGMSVSHVKQVRRHRALVTT